MPSLLVKHAFQNTKHLRFTGLVCLLLVSSSLLAKDIGQEKARSILVSQKPLALILNEIKNDSDQVEALISESSSAHYFQLKPSDIKKIASADLVVWSGSAHEPFLKKAISKQKQQLNIMGIDGVDYIFLKKSHQHNVAHNQEYQLQASADPHIWFDTSNAIMLARAMTSTLGYGNKKQKAFEKSIEQLQKVEIIKKQNASIIVYHDAYQYLLRQLGLEHDFVIDPEHQLGFGLKNWQAFHQQLMADRSNSKRSCIITQAGFEKSQLARKLANYPNIKIVEIDPIASDKSYKSYSEFWQASTNKLQSCFDA